MDLVYITYIALLWGMTVALKSGFQKLDQQPGERS